VGAGYKHPPAKNVPIQPQATRKRSNIVAAIPLGAVTTGEAAVWSRDAPAPELSPVAGLEPPEGTAAPLAVAAIPNAEGKAEASSRSSNKRARYLPNFDYSGRLEMLVWSIPAMAVLLVGGVAWVGSHDLDQRKLMSSTAKPVRVQVVSLDWKWLFIYPDQGIATVNQLTIPVGTPVSFELTSSGVINSFFVPQLGSQIYTMAGMVTRLHLQADHSGKYRGLSAQFSGDGFADMRFNVEAVPAENFAQWVTAARAAGPVRPA
jgi:cytochrome o ubiquinol oxidase subunit II